MSADIIRHPGVTDLRNARNRARWAERYYGGVHFADLRSPELFRRGEWIALQVARIRSGHWLLPRLSYTERRASRAALIIARARRGHGSSR